MTRGRHKAEDRQRERAQDLGKEHVCRSRGDIYCYRKTLENLRWSRVENTTLVTFQIFTIFLFKNFRACIVYAHHVFQSFRGSHNSSSSSSPRSTKRFTSSPFSQLDE